MAFRGLKIHPKDLRSTEDSDCDTGYGSKPGCVTYSTGMSEARGDEGIGNGSKSANHHETCKRQRKLVISEACQLIVEVRILEGTDWKYLVTSSLANTPRVSPPKPSNNRPPTRKILSLTCIPSAKINSPSINNERQSTQIRRSPYRWTAKPEIKGNTMFGAEYTM